MLTNVRVILGLLRLYFGYFGVGVGSENCFGFSLYRLSTFIFWPCYLLAFLLLTNFRVISQLGSGQKTVLESQYSDWKVHFLSNILYHIFNVNPIEGHFGPLGLTLGSGYGQKTFWGLRIQSIKFHVLSMHLNSIFNTNQFYGHFLNFGLYSAILGSEKYFRVSISR